MLYCRSWTARATSCTQDPQEARSTWTKTRRSNPVLCRKASATVIPCCAEWRVRRLRRLRLGRGHRFPYRLAGRFLIGPRSAFVRRGEMMWLGECSAGGSFQPGESSLEVVPTVPTHTHINIQFSVLSALASLALPQPLQLQTNGVSLLLCCSALACPLGPVAPSFWRSRRTSDLHLSSRIQHSPPPPSRQKLGELTCKLHFVYCPIDNTCTGHPIEYIAA